MMNGKYLCVDSSSISKVKEGDIITFINGIPKLAGKELVGTYQNLKDWNERNIAKLKEVEEKSPKEKLEHLDIVTLRMGSNYIFIKTKYYYNDYITSSTGDNSFRAFHFTNELKYEFGNSSTAIKEQRDIMKITTQYGTIKWQRESENEIAIRKIDEEIKLLEDKKKELMK